MSKLVFCVCAFLLVGADFAVGQSESNKTKDSPNDVLETKNELNYFMDCHTKYIKHVAMEILNETSENAPKLRDHARNIANLASANFFSAQEKVNSEIKSGLNDSIDVNMTACFEMALNYSRKGFSVLGNTHHCLSDAIKGLDVYIQNITKQSDILMKKFTSFKIDVDNCVKNISKSDPEPRASQCVKDVSYNATLFMVRQVTSFYSKRTNPDFKISALMQKLNTCSTVNVDQKVNESSSDFVEKVKACVKTQMANAAMKS